MDKLNKEFKERWVKSLLSGEFKQGFFASYHPVTDKYCILGVGGMELMGVAYAGYKIFDNKDIKDELVGMNDVDGVPFEIFAGIINEWL